jgi:hypothetical protein
VLTQSWRSKSAVFRMYCALTFNGYSNSIKAVKRQRNFGLVRMEILAENVLTYFYLRHVVIVVTAVTTISLTHTPLQHDFALDPMIPSFVFHFSNICHVTTRKPRLPQCIMEDDLHINKQTNICIANHTRLL